MRLVSVPSSSLVNTSVTARQAVNGSRRKRRTFQRALSGLQQRGRTYRFITLALGPDGTPAELQVAWHRLVERLRRRKLLKDFIKVVERGPENGSLHIHVLYTGKYIDAYLLRDQWIAVSGKRYVWIARVKHASPKGAANELAKYMGKDPHARCAYSRHWAFPRLAAYWLAWKREARMHAVRFDWMLWGWKYYCFLGIPPPILLPSPKGVGRGSIGTDLSGRSSLAPRYRSAQLALLGPGRNPG